MPQYRITLERTVRIEKWFEAGDDDGAKMEAHFIHLQTDDVEYENGESEYDYALSDSLGRDLIYFGG